MKKTLHLAEVWMTHADGTVVESSLKTPLRDSASMSNYFDAWLAKELILERRYSREALREYLRLIFSLPHAKVDKDYQRISQFPPENSIMTDGNFLQGSIGVMIFQPLPQGALDILIRFANVFEFLFPRLLNRQKAQAQAKKAQIQLLLDPIRAKAMAMQHSNPAAFLHHKIRDGRKWSQTSKLKN